MARELVRLALPDADPGRASTVVAVDQRGIGLSEKPAGRYDAATLATESPAWPSPRSLDPQGVRQGLTKPPDPPVFVPEGANTKLWHIPTNRVSTNSSSTWSRATPTPTTATKYQVQGGGKTLPDYAMKYYIKLYTRDRNALRASFGFYRAWDAHLTQNEARQPTKLTTPVSRSERPTAG